MATVITQSPDVHCVAEVLTEEATDLFSNLMAAGESFDNAPKQRIHHTVDPAAIALTGGNISLIPSLGRVIIRSLALVPGAGHLYIARDETGSLVAFTLFALPGQLMGSTCVL